MKKFASTTIALIINIAILCFIIYLIPKVTMKAYQIAKDFVSQPSESEKVSKEIKITIPDGASTKEIANILKKNELIGSADIFTLKVKFSNYDGTFKKGDYSLNTSMSESKIMDILRDGAKVQTDIVFTIPEGYTAIKIAKKLEKEGIINADEFLKAVNEGQYNYDFLVDIPKRDSKLEGYLFPDTYFFRKDVTGEQIVSKLLSRFSEIYIDEYAIEAKAKGYSMDEIISMASIVEKEAKLDSERPRIAGVIYNRLKENIELQMDSTVNYAFELKNGLNNDRNEESVSLDDLKIKSFYNTYANVGLPIGPICNPGKDAIEAVIYPEHNNYLYFVLKDPVTGEHEFTNTHQEHVAAKNKYKQ